MSKHTEYLILLVFILWFGESGSVLANPIIEGDVIVSNALPDWGYVCQTSDVRGGPSLDYPVIYSVFVGERIRIHDQSRPTGEWVSIKAAHWIPLENLCR